MATTNIFEDKYYGHKEVDPSKAGTHMQRRRGIDGWRNTCAPVRKDNGGKRPIRKARARLAARTKAFGGKNKESGHTHHAPGSLKVA